MKIIHVAVLIIGLIVLAKCASAQVSQKELSDLASLRTGNGSSVAFGGFADIEAQGQNLAQQHADAKSQGRIYARMAEVYSISGPGVADKTAEYAQKALACPLEPKQELDTYLRWGDALQLVHGPANGDKLAAVRREAVMAYLQGLKAALKYNLPDDPMPVQRGGGFLRYEGINQKAVMERFEREQRARAAAAAAIDQQNDLIMTREFLIGQIVFLYSRKPFATDEIRALAAQVISDDHLTGRLMAAVEDTVNERTTNGGPGTPYMLKVMPKFQAVVNQAGTPVPAKPAAATTPQP